MIPPSSLAFSLLEGHPCWSTCGRRTRPFSGRAFREHRTNVGALPILSIVGAPRAMESSSPLPLLLHDIYNQTSQRFREEVRRLMGHAFPCRRDGLHFADPGRVEQQGSGSRSLRHPIQSFMIILCIEDGLLFLLRRTQCRDNELLEQRYIELGARRGLCGWTMGWLQAQCDVAAFSLQG